VALSANAYGDDVQRSLAAGMNAHIAKPIDKAELFQTLSRLFNNNPSEASL
jgi:CheY-like chemotaxis protein